jgi:hypothetical protein
MYRLRHKQSTDEKATKHQIGEQKCQSNGHLRRLPAFSLLSTTIIHFFFFHTPTMPLSADQHEYTEESCRDILEEVISLLEVMRQPTSHSGRLNVLLANHFGSNIFRSFCCFGHDAEDVPLELFNSLCFLPSNDWKVSLDFMVGSPSTIQPLPVEPSFSSAHYLLHQKYQLACGIINTLLISVLESHPEKDFIKGYLPNIGDRWSLSILGLKDRDRKFVVPSLYEIRRRISLSLDGAVVKKRLHPASNLFSPATGFLWQSLDDSFDVNKVYLDVCSAFPKRLEKLLLSSGKTLDQLAGVEVLHPYPIVEAIVRDALSRGRMTGFESVDLKHVDGSLGGTVFAIHNAHYSVEWIASYLVDADNNYFMEDVRAAVLVEKQRLLRIFSSCHTDNEPGWIQFGDKAHVFIYLSRLASAAEQGFLKIQSFVINLLIDDINKALKPLDSHGKYQLEHYHYDTGVVALGNPTSSSLGPHQDGKPGIVCPHTFSFSRFMLMVPTMAFQNNCGPTATVSWFRSDDPKKIKQAIFTHDFFINHFQLMGVNDNFTHEVRTFLRLQRTSILFFISYVTRLKPI